MSRLLFPISQFFYLLPFITSLIIILPSTGLSDIKQKDYLNKGIANLKEENYEEAVEDLKRAREVDPTSSTAAYFLGIAYKRIENYKESKLHLKDAIQLQPPVKEAVIELADTLLQLGELDEALKTVEIAEREGIQAAQTAFLKGLILLKLGKNMDAIDTFKKAKGLDEGLTQSADYQIGLAKLKEGRLKEAREIFKEVVVKDPNTDIAQFANQYIDALKRRIKEERPFRFTLGFQYQYDDNVLLKPGDATAAAGITGEDDSVEVYTLRGEYTPRLKGPFNIKTQYSLYLNNHHKYASHDVQSHTIGVVPGYNLPRGQISLTATYNYTLVDDNRYLQTLTLSPLYAFPLNTNQFAQLFLRYQKKEYERPPLTADEDRDSHDYGIGARWFYLLKEDKGFINARYELNKEDTQGKNWGYDGHKFGLTLLYPITDLLKFNCGLEAYIQRYNEQHTVFGVKRDDDTYTASLILSYTIYDDIDIQVQYAYVRADSNIAVYDYDRYITGIGLEWRY